MAHIRTDLFEQRDTLDRGKGLFAKTSIAAGTLLIAEDPLIHTMSVHYNTRDLIEIFLPLSHDQKFQYLSLAAKQDDQTEHLGKRVSDVRERIQNIKEGNDDEATKRWLVEQLEEKALDCQGEFKVVATFRTNAIEICPPETDEDFVGPSEGIYLTASRLNHSCIPNTNLNVNYNTLRLEVRVTQNIKPGDELTFSYLGQRSWYQDTPTRQGKLDKWTFTCKCEACHHPDANPNEPEPATTNKQGKGKKKAKASPKPPKSAEHESNRKVLFQNQMEIQALSTAIEDDEMDADSATQLLDLHLRDIVLLEKEGCADMEMARLRQKAAQLYAIMGRWKAAVVQARKGWEVVEKAVGKESVLGIEYWEFKEELEMKGFEAEGRDRKGKGKSRR